MTTLTRLKNSGDNVKKIMGALSGNDTNFHQPCTKFAMIFQISSLFELRNTGICNEWTGRRKIIQ